MAKPQDQDVPGYVRREDVAQAEVARRVDQPAAKSQEHQDRPERHVGDIG
jgi:hypothetical protein